MTQRRQIRTTSRRAAGGTKAHGEAAQAKTARQARLEGRLEAEEAYGVTGAQPQARRGNEQEAGQPTHQELQSWAAARQYGYRACSQVRLPASACGAMQDNKQSRRV